LTYLDNYFIINIDKNIIGDQRPNLKTGRHRKAKRIGNLKKIEMKKLLQNLSLITLLFLCNFAFGQNNMEDVVYLKNGSIIRGIIIEQIPNQSLKIQTKDRNVFVFKYDEILKITKEYLPTDELQNSSNSKSYKKSGFINLTEINYCPGIGDITLGNSTVKNIDNSFGFKTVNGYQINEHLSIGLGLGLDKYTNATLIPISFDARATFIKGQVSPVFNANVGYSVGLNGVSGGMVINPSIGIKAYISNNVAYLFNVGYKWQAQDVTYYQYSYYYNKQTTNVYYQFITISTGFAF
jgi:hypothetical protein